MTSADARVMLRAWRNVVDTPVSHLLLPLCCISFLQFRRDSLGRRDGSLEAIRDLLLPLSFRHESRGPTATTTHHRTVGGTSKETETGGWKRWTVHDHVNDTHASQKLELSASRDRRATSTYVLRTRLDLTHRFRLRCASVDRK
jgi:hypothetical protein